MPPRSPLAPEAPPTLPPIAGVRLAARACGVRYKDRTDVCLLAFDAGTTVAGVFTRSLTASAPVERCRKHLKGGRARAILVNSGNANAFTRKGRTARLDPPRGRQQVREDVVVVDQFYDLTRFRPNTFFADGIVGHVMFADPVCPNLAALAAEAAEGKVARVHRGGTYLCVEGPAFSTRAESRIHRGWGVDVIGMTNMPEAKLAREAALCYATVALATDYDCWHESEEDVTIGAVLAIIRRNVDNAKGIIREVARRLPGEIACGCADALRHAIITDPRKVPAATRKRLALLVGKRP